MLKRLIEVQWLLCQIVWMLPWVGIAFIGICIATVAFTAIHGPKAGRSFYRSHIGR